MSQYFREVQTRPMPVVTTTPSSPPRRLPSRLPRLPQPPRKRRLWPWLVAIGALVVFGVGMLSYALGEPSTGVTSTPAAHSTTGPTHAATPTSSVKGQPTAQASSVPTAHPTQQQAPTNGPAMVGGELGAFVVAYGHPNDHSFASSGLYHFKRYASSTLDFLIVKLDLADGGAYANRAEDITVQAPDAGWSQSEATAACAAFLPRDAVYKQQISLATGYDKIYTSATLAGLFPASVFVDVNAKQVQAGSFDVQYLYRSGTIIASCDILIGTQQTQV